MKKLLLLIIARSINNMIGFNNNLPWGRLKDDMNSFMDLTMGGVVIMGRLTAESILKKLNSALPGRTCIVVSRQSQQELQYLIAAGFTVCSSIEEAMREAEKTDCEKIWIAGGAQIYRMFIENPNFIIDEIYLTEVLGEFEGDVECPDLQLGEYLHDENPKSFEKIEKRNACSFTIHHYIRLRA